MRHAKSSQARRVGHTVVQCCIIIHALFTYTAADKEDKHTHSNQNLNWWENYTILMTTVSLRRYSLLKTFANNWI